ncbi:hypothetical protein CBL_01640 [Carabus blaptoides fortunei]
MELVGNTLDEPKNDAATLLKILFRAMNTQGAIFNYGIPFLVKQVERRQIDISYPFECANSCNRTIPQQAAFDEKKLLQHFGFKMDRFFVFTSRLSSYKFQSVH